MIFDFAALIGNFFKATNVFRDFGSLTGDFMAAAMDPSLWGTAMDAAAKATAALA
jgi:hypothetical protein